MQKDQCSEVIDMLLAAIAYSGWQSDCSLIVYGSYFDQWHDQSDLDAMLYFAESFDPTKTSCFRESMKELYAAIPTSKDDHFFSDVFVLDQQHIKDGRFLMFDQEFIRNFRRSATWRVVLGEDFLPLLHPVALRNQNEFELANGLHHLRNYLLFEVPKGWGDVNQARLDAAVKYFKILPRVVSFVLDQPMAKSFGWLTQIFPEIDYQPLIEFGEAMKEPRSRMTHVMAWHQSDSRLFQACLGCFEQTLVRIIQTQPRKSQY